MRWRRVRTWRVSAAVAAQRLSGQLGRLGSAVFPTAGRWSVEQLVSGVHAEIRSLFRVTEIENDVPVWGTNGAMM